MQQSVPVSAALSTISVPQSVQQSVQQCSTAVGASQCSSRCNSAALQQCSGPCNQQPVRATSKRSVRYLRIELHRFRALHGLVSINVAGQPRQHLFPLLHYSALLHCFATTVHLCIDIGRHMKTCLHSSTFSNMTGRSMSSATSRGHAGARAHAVYRCGRRLRLVRWLSAQSVQPVCQRMVSTQ